MALAISKSDIIVFFSMVNETRHSESDKLTTMSCIVSDGFKLISYSGNEPIQIIKLFPKILVKHRIKWYYNSMIMRERRYKSYINIARRRAKRWSLMV